MSGYKNGPQRGGKGIGTTRYIPMPGYKNGQQRGGKNRRTKPICPTGLQASDTPMSSLERTGFWHHVQQPDQLLAMVMNGDLCYDQLDPEVWVEIEQAAESRRIFEESLRVKDENDALKAENAALKAENAALKSQLSSPPAPQSLNETGYRDAVTISPETIHLRKIANFFRRVRLFFILLDAFNQIIKLRCKFDDDEAEIEGCGSVLRKIFELVTSTTANISENILTIPDLDFKFHGSKKDFEEFAKNVSEWVSENKLMIPDAHFIIGKMRRFTARKPMSNGEIAEYEKFMIDVIDSSTKEIFMIDIMNMDGSTVFPNDFSINSLTVSPTRGIYAKDPLHRKGKFNFLGVIRNITSRKTTCMTKSSWKFDAFSLNFLVREIKIHSSYEMQGAPILEISRCPITLDDNALCVSLTGCRCKKTTGEPIPYRVSISAAISLHQSGKRCPNCRGNLNEFICSVVKSRQTMSDTPKELLSQDDFEYYVSSNERISENYSFSGFKNISERSNEALSRLAEFSRPLMSNEERDSDIQMRAGGDSAAPALASSMRASGGSAQSAALASSMRASGGSAQSAALASSMRASGGSAQSAALASSIRASGEYNYIRRHGS
jgi:hypothetical protein